MARKASSVESARLKLSRAAKHLKAIKRSIAEYSASRPYEVATQADGKKRYTILKPPPPAISILSGEMIYQMRSALDHLAFGLVERNHTGVTLPPRWEESCYFPLKIKIPTHGRPPIPFVKPVPQAEFSKTLPGLSVAAHTFIERAQPYYETPELNNALGFLAITVGRIRESESIRFKSGIAISGVHTLEHGSKIPPLRTGTDRPVQVHRHYGMSVHFDGRKVMGLAHTVPLDYLLQVILNQIETFVVPALEKFIKAP